VIRIKADNGDDYYVDDKNSVMPNTSYTSDLVIATGYISRSFATKYLSPLGKAVMANDLWKNLIEQIHVLPDRSIELVPRVGDHIIYIGKLPEYIKGGSREKTIADFMERKLVRLEKFYKYGLSYAGWNKYSYINIEFDNQIICKKRSYTTEQTVPVADIQMTAAPQQSASDTTATKRKDKEAPRQTTEKKEKTS